MTRCAQLETHLFIVSTLVKTYVTIPLFVRSPEFKAEGNDHDSERNLQLLCAFNVDFERRRNVLENQIDVRAVLHRGIGDGVAVQSDTE